MQAGEKSVEDATFPAPSWTLAHTLRCTAEKRLGQQSLRYENECEWSLCPEKSGCLDHGPRLGEGKN